MTAPNTHAAVHCRSGGFCTLHDCMCSCDGCLPHSAPHVLEIRRLQKTIATLQSTCEEYESRIGDLMSAETRARSRADALQTEVHDMRDAVGAALGETCSEAFTRVMRERSERAAGVWCSGQTVEIGRLREQVTHLQTRGTELVEERRELKAKLEAAEGKDLHSRIRAEALQTEVDRMRDVVGAVVGETFPQALDRVIQRARSEEWMRRAEVECEVEAYKRAIDDGIERAETAERERDAAKQALEMCLIQLKGKSFDVEALKKRAEAAEIELNREYRRQAEERERVTAAIARAEIFEGEFRRCRNIIGATSTEPLSSAVARVTGERDEFAHEREVWKQRALSAEARFRDLESAARNVAEWFSDKSSNVKKVPSLGDLLLKLEAALPDVGAWCWACGGYGHHAPKCKPDVDPGIRTTANRDEIKTEEDDRRRDLRGVYMTARGKPDAGKPDAGPQS